MARMLALASPHWAGFAVQAAKQPGERQERKMAQAAPAPVPGAFPSMSARRWMAQDWLERDGQLLRKAEAMRALP